MFSLRMANFRKSAQCPSSQELLAYQNGELAPRDQIDVQRHIIDCEFCDAEVELYADFPQTTSEEECNPAVGEIPHALYELAEALLERKYADNSKF
jgi:anti-sigma factor RsiW